MGLVEFCRRDFDGRARLRYPEHTNFEAHSRHSINRESYSFYQVLLVKGDDSTSSASTLKGRSVRVVERSSIQLRGLSCVMG